MSGDAVLAVLVVALACLTMRLGGYWASTSLNLPAVAIEFIENVPAPLLAALVFAAAWSLHPAAGLTAGMVTILVMRWWPNEIAAALGGTIAAWATLLLLT